MRSEVAPGQFVSSNSCKWRNWIRLDNPVEVSKGQPRILKKRNDYLRYRSVEVFLCKVRKGIRPKLNKGEKVNKERTKKLEEDQI